MKWSYAPAPRKHVLCRTVGPEHLVALLRCDLDVIHSSNPPRSVTAARVAVTRPRRHPGRGPAAEADARGVNHTGTASGSSISVPFTVMRTGWPNHARG